MRMRRRIPAPVGFVVLGAVVAVLIGYPFVHHVVAERNGLARRIADLQHGFNQEQARAAALKDKLDTRDREIAAADLRQQRDELWRASQEQSAKQSAARLSQLDDELEAARRGGKQVRQANAKLQQRLDELQTQSAALQQQLVQHDDALTQAHEQRRKLETLLAARQQTAARLQQQLAEAQQAAKRAQQTGGRLQQRLDEQQMRLAAAQKIARERTAQIAQLTSSLQQARDRQQALQAKIDAANSTQQAAEARIADLEKRLASAQRPGASAVSAVLAPATGGNESLQRRLAELQTQLSRYTAQRPGASNPATHDSDDLAAARQRAARLTAEYKARLENATKLKHVDAGTLNQLATVRSALEKAQAELARIEGARGIYTVQGGDSLSLIAAFFYHNGNRWPQIFKSNAFLVSNPDLIFPGMVLIIPE